MMRKKLWTAGVTLLLMGLICIIMKAFTPEFIDAQGFLHEAFFLLPIGFLLIFTGVILIIISAFKKHQ